MYGFIILMQFQDDLGEGARSWLSIDREIKERIQACSHDIHLGESYSIFGNYDYLIPFCAPSRTVAHSVALALRKYGDVVEVKQTSPVEVHQPKTVLMAATA